MKKKVLWFENDRSYVLEFRKSIPDHIELTDVRYIKDAETALLERRWDLLILDIAIPCKFPEEEEKYPPSETEKGLKTGLVFYKRWKDQLEKDGTKVFVFTIVTGANIRKEFLQIGLPAEYFATRFQITKPSAFWEKICNILYD